MSLFNAIGAAVAVVALFGYLNHRLIKLPDTIGITVVGLIASVVVALLGRFDPAIARWASLVIAGIDFPEVVFHGMLGLLLFAGSLHVNVADLNQDKWLILVLSTVGVVVSTAIVGVGFYYGTRSFGFALPFAYCLLFGALISPTDPISVLGVLRRVGVSKRLETQLVAESLFNDGMGVVVFLTLLGMATGTHDLSVSSAVLLLSKEVAGGVAVGAVLGAVGVLLLRGIDSYPVEILITLAMPTGGYGLAEALHTSAPIAVVVMGLVVGNQGKKLAMSKRTQQQLFALWDLVDKILNLMLFGLIGLEVVALSISVNTLAAGLLAIPVVLLARWISSGLPILAMRPFREFSPHVVKILTWGGLRGGLSVALALSLPAFPGRDSVLAASYIVVIFSILVQALTLGPLVEALGHSKPDEIAR
jgi:CPA1 family monovalent cation:H+ antiporter